MNGIIVALVLPLTALVSGTAALAQELEDGTGLYLLGKPLAHWRIIVEKAAVAWVATAAVLVVSVAGAGLIYVFVREALVTKIVDGARYVSIREFTLGIAGALADAPQAPPRAPAADAGHPG